MKYGKYMFESFKEFQQILSLATANGVGTGEKFFNFFKCFINLFFPFRTLQFHYQYKT